MPRRETRLCRPDDEINRQVAVAFMRSLDGTQEIGTVNVEPPQSIRCLHWRRHLVVDSREINLTVITQPNPPYQRLDDDCLGRIMRTFKTRFSLSETTLPRMKRCDNPYLDASNRSKLWEDDSGQMWMMFVKCPEFAIVEESHGLDQFGTDTDEPAPYHHFIDRVFVEMLIHVEFARVAAALFPPTFPMAAPLPSTQDFVFPTSQQLSDIAHHWMPPINYGPINAGAYAGGFHVNVPPPTPSEPEEEVDLFSLKNTLKHSLKGLGEGCRELRMAKLNGEGGFSDN